MTATALQTAREWEADWWGDCRNTFGEEAKQLTYAHKMGLINEPRDGKWPVYDLAGKSVLDIGGGPVSMLLKTTNGTQLTVVDPCPYPEWVEERYRAAGIDWVQESAEEFSATHRYDEAWIYNCLQHVIDPEKIIANARSAADTIRIFEWVNMEIDQGHPHSLKPELLDEWLGGRGVVGYVNENGAIGEAYWGVFE